MHLKSPAFLFLYFQGGIWHVPEWAYEETKKAGDYKDLWESYAGIAEIFGEIWIGGDISYQDLDVPLLSAIAARLFLLTRAPDGLLPIDVEEQAEYVYDESCKPIRISIIDYILIKNSNKMLTVVLLISLH